MVSDGLRLLRGGAVAVPVVGQSVDPVVFQDSCLRAFEASQVARGFAQTTMDNGAGVLDRFLVACDRPAWEVTREDVDRVVAGLVGQGLSAATRRGYVQTFKGFHAFLSARKAGEIEAAFGVRHGGPGRRVQRRTACRLQLAVGDRAAEPATDGGVLRLPQGTRCWGPQVRGGRAGLRDVPHPVPRRLAGGGDRVVGPRRRALRPRPVREDPRAFRQGSEDLGPATAVGADARRARPDPGLVSRGDRPTSGRGSGVVLRRGRRADPPGHDPQPARLPARPRTRGPRPGTAAENRSWSGSARTRCATPARPATTSAVWISSRSSRCSGTGTSGRRCAT